MCLTTVSACELPLSEPVVASFNGDSVAIQVHGISIYTTDEQEAESRQKRDQKANEICRRGHRKNAEYVSVRFIPTNQYGSYGYNEYLYLCLR